jgi:hypothetical protein
MVKTNYRYLHGFGIVQNGHHSRKQVLAQLPLLKRSLRAMRNEEFDLQTNLDIEVKKYLGTILVSLKADT